MAKYLNTNAYISINSVDLSNNAFRVDINLTKDQVDVSGFNATSTKEFLPGPKDEEFTVGFLQDFAANKVDATLWPLYSGGSAFPFTIIPSGTVATSTNPSYSGSATLYEYHPLDGQYGERSETSVTFKIQGGVNRGTA